jgi:dTDP-4-dehydrorhamnose reductase
MTNILITGSKGQLGKSIFDEVNKSSDKYFFTDVDELDITNKQAVEDFVINNKIDVVVNCAAYTAVDKAETDVEKAFLLNSEAVENLANACLANNAFLIHISTDYVFDGTNDKPYTEVDKVNPMSIYGKSKLDGERKLLNMSKAMIIRTSWLYSNYGSNFVFTMQRLAKEKTELNVVSDQVGSPTYAKYLAKAIVQIIPQLTTWNEGLQIYHFSNEGVCSWYDFAKEIIELSGLNKCKVVPIKSKDYPTAAKRPEYSVLDKSKIKQRFNLVIPQWHEGLKDMIKTSITKFP